MTRSKKLDKILNALIHIDKLILDDTNIPKKITFEFLCESLNLGCEKWEIKSLKKELLYDQQITEENDEIKITDHGIKFIIKGGYSNSDDITLQNEIIRKNTIKQFRYDKIALGVAILSLIVAIFALASR